MFFISYVAWTEEFKIRDQYRFIEQMPIKWLNYTLCIGVILLAFIYSCLPLKKDKIMAAFVVLIIAITVTTSVKNYMYYSEETKLLEQRYEKLISEEKMENLLKRKERAYIYIDTVEKKGKWEDSQKIYDVVRKKFYEEQMDFYVFRPLNDKDYEYLESLKFQNFPVLIVITDKKTMKFYYNESILTYLKVE